MNIYLINKIQNSNFSLADEFWQPANIIEVNNWPWHKETYTPPKVSACLLYSNTHLFVKFHVNENYIRAQYTNYQSRVCQDSCIEFFVSPDNKEYFNFEVSAIGTMLFCQGKDRCARKRICQEDGSTIHILTTLPYNHPIPENIKCPAEGYSVAYSIPLILFTKYTDAEIPITGTEWTGNFYKCGDNTKEPSWGCWNPVKTDKPDFHRPEYFGKLIFN